MEWIKTSDRLPKDGQEVDIWLSNLMRREPNVIYKDKKWVQEGKVFKNIGTMYVGVTHWAEITTPNGIKQAGLC